METFFAHYSSQEFVLIATCFRATHAFSALVTLGTTVLYGRLDYFKRWNDRVDISCVIRLNIFLILYLVGGLGMFPWWEWKSYKGVSDNKFVCVSQGLLQDIGAFGSFLELLFMCCILFSLILKRDIFGLTFAIINTRHVIICITIFICVISVFGAIVSLYLRNWCTTGPIDKLDVDLIHILFYGPAWLVTGCMIFCAKWLYLNNNFQHKNKNKLIKKCLNNNCKPWNTVVFSKKNKIENLNLELGHDHENVNTSTLHRFTDRIAMNDHETQSNNSAGVSADVMTSMDNSKNIALNIFLLSSCIFTSTLIYAIAGIHFFINGSNASKPPLLFAILGSLFLQLYPALISIVMIFKCRKHWWKCIGQQCHKLINYCDKLGDRYGRNCNYKYIFCTNNDRNQSTNVQQTLFDVEIDIINNIDIERKHLDVSLSIDVDLVYDNDHTNEYPRIDSSSFNDSSEEVLFGQTNESMLVNERSINVIESSCVTVSQ